MELSGWLLIVGLLVAAIITYIMFADKIKNAKKADKSKLTKALDSLATKGNPGGEIIEDYNFYEMAFKEKLLNIMLAASCIIVVGMIFYRNIYLAVFFTPLALLYPKIKLKSIIKKRKEMLLIQFKEALYLVSSSLAAGKSVESAFCEAIEDLMSLFSSEDTLIIVEFKYIAAKLAMNETIEEIFIDFAARSKVEDIANFADIFVVSKRTGGNLVEAIKNSVKVIAEKIEFKQELNTMLAQKKFEQKLLNVIPIGMILLLSWMSPDYMEPVFTTVLGRIAMTVAVAILLVSYFISKKIMDIEV
ncbi:type II secretion system F family protein [candidate division NPL-UPA2 bacterium]|nr:type II secretion system F family protein [candidate division NPL-UPA2 bacterium]